MLKTVPFLTKIAKAATNSDSVRTTIPKEIAQEFDLSPQDVLIWTVNKGKINVEKWNTGK